MQKQKDDHPIVVVGAGLGGLAAALHLSAAGRRVIIFEKNERVGGKLNIIQESGYCFDIGPSLLTMPWVLRETLAVAGTSLEDELVLLPVEPACRYYWPDATRFEMWESLPRLLDAIQRLEPADVGGFLRFMAYTSQIYDVAAEPFMLRPFNNLRELITPALVSSSLAIDPLRTVDQAVSSFFKSPYLRQLFNRYATYNGSSPYRAPATFNIIPFVEISQGAWYVRGGMYAIAQALERSARKLGVEIHTNSPVTNIRSAQGRANSVVLANGEHIQAAALIVNADPRYAYSQLIEGGEATARRLNKLELSCSGFILLLGISRQYEVLAQHTIFFSQDYPREFEAIFDRGVPAPDPTIYVNVTSQTDSQHAPPGHMNLFVLVNAPAHTGRINWQREAEGYADLIIRKLERMGLTGLSAHIDYRHIITPAELQERYNAPGGAIYGLASNSPWTAFLRPPIRARDHKGLYFVGGGTHPGGGIPLVLLSGRAVALMVNGE